MDLKIKQFIKNNKKVNFQNKNENKDDKNNKRKKKIGVLKKVIFKNKKEKEKDIILDNKKDEFRKDVVEVHKENKNNNDMKRQIKNNEFKNQTPYKEFEINDEIYDGELFMDKNSNLSSIYNNCITKASFSQSLIKIKDFPTMNSLKLEEIDNNIKLNENKAKKDLIKLIDSSRTKSSKKIYYHKNKKPLFKNNNYNVQYNINNSFNIQNVQNNISFTSNNLTIMTSESFNIKSTYTNLNQISKGKYPTDLNFQSKIKKMFQKKYGKNKKVKLNVNMSEKNIKTARSNNRKSFFQ
jgi:hypothetical protein